jgi:hypothetical protein
VLWLGLGSEAQEVRYESEQDHFEAFARRCRLHLMASSAYEPALGFVAGHAHGTEDIMIPLSYTSMQLGKIQSEHDGVTHAQQAKGIPEAEEPIPYQSFFFCTCRSCS